MLVRLIFGCILFPFLFSGCQHPQPPPEPPRESLPQRIQRGAEAEARRGIVGPYTKAYRAGRGPAAVPLHYPAGILPFRQWVRIYYPHLADEPRLAHDTLAFLERDYERYLRVATNSQTPPAPPAVDGPPAPAP